MEKSRFTTFYKDDNMLNINKLILLSLINIIIN